MYEDQTFDVIIHRMIDRVSDEFDRRPGSIIYDTMSPTAKELELVYQNLAFTLKQLNPLTADREYLEYWCNTFGITPLPATFAVHVAECIFYDDTKSVEIGSRFSQNALTFEVIEQIDDTHYYIRCEQAGEVGNDAYGIIVPVMNVNGLKSARITALAIPGEDVESDKDLLDRFLLTLVEKPFGGNMADYKKTLMSLQGIGGYKIIRHFEEKDFWVGVIIVDSEMNSPSQETIDYVQNELHPLLPEYKQAVIENSGDGLVPIGHVVIVEGAETEEIDVTLNLILEDGYSFESIRELLTSAVQEYFKELAGTWKDSEYLIIRTSGIESKVLNVPGVIDCFDTLLNGERANFSIDELSIPKLGRLINGNVEG